MIELKEDFYMEGGCKVFKSHYEIVSKEWRWFECLKSCGGGLGLNSVMCDSFFDAWMFDEVMEIKFKGNNGRRGLLLTFDKDRMWTTRVKEGLLKQIKVEIVRDVILTVFGGEDVLENGVKKLFIEGYDFGRFCDEWINRIRGRKITNKENEEKVYVISVDGKIRYKTLYSGFFRSLGFSSDFFYNGFYDMSKKRLVFTSFLEWSIRRDFWYDKENSQLLFFNGEYNDRYEVYKCSFDGDLEEFKITCSFMLGN